MSDHYNKANEAFIDENYAEALTEYTNAINAEQKEEYYVKRAACYLKLDQPRKALQDANSALKLNSSNVNAYYRRGIAYFELEEYESAKESFEQCSSFPDQASVKRWIRKCEAEIVAEDEESDDDAPSSVPQKQNTSTNTPSKTEEKKEQPKQQEQIKKEEEVTIAANAALPPVKTSIRHEWYQAPTFVCVTIFAKNVKKEDTHVELKTKSLSVSIKLSESSEYALDLNLCDEIIPEESTTTHFATKIEIKMIKKTQSKWLALEETAAGPFKTLAWADSSAVNKAEYPTSSKIKKNWDAISKSVEEEQLSGDQALNKVFQDIYGKGSEEQRRAMMKSFVESGGTVLSTNWEDVGSRKVEGSPPKGQEMHSWKELTS